MLLYITVSISIAATTTTTTTIIVNMIHICMTMIDHAITIGGSTPDATNSWCVPPPPRQNIMLWQHFPCSPAAKTTLQPRMCCFEWWIPHMSSSPEECFFHRHRYFHCWQTGRRQRAAHICTLSIYRKSINKGQGVHSSPS